MGCSRIPQPIHRFNHGINRRIKSDREISVRNIIINRAG